MSSVPRKKGAKLSDDDMPSYKDDGYAWNEAWERKLLNFGYGTNIALTLEPRRKCVNIIDQIPEALFAVATHESVLQNNLVLQTEIFQLQCDLSIKRNIRFSSGNFERRWTWECTEKERELWLLEGMVRTCESSPDSEDSRMYCPEVTLARLNHDSGRGFIELLKKLTWEKGVPFRQGDFKTVPNEIWEAMNTPSKDPEHPGKKMMKRCNDIQRTLFLTYFVWNTLLAFYGERVTYGQMKTGNEKGWHEELQKIIGNSNPELTKIMENAKRKGEAMQRQANAQRACVVCRKTAETVGIQKLLACQRCTAIGRNVFYCSKECQVQDWKNGSPTHKSICGDTAALTKAVSGQNKA
ncbi:hypothetical protein V5O48_003026 [Marasmius crinis-equi]|uniref:MYND-type domain-containing protein n=1 Tax=Marasmius crinis-equi TaxID=585013 RepID=A0ABR3FUU7_9AGAR